MVYGIAAYAILGVNVKALSDRIDKNAEPDKIKSQNLNTKNRPPIYEKAIGGFANSWR